MPFEPKKSAGEAREELLSLYKQAVKRQLISDVPVGLLLSGGVDSGLLLALMNLNGSSWPTYTVGYGSTFADDELADGAETARILGAKHTALQLQDRSSRRRCRRLWIAWRSPSRLPRLFPCISFVNEPARTLKSPWSDKGRTNCLVDIGVISAFAMARMWARLPHWVRGPISSAIDALPRNETLKRGVYSLAIPDRMRRYQYVLSLLPGEQVDSLFQDGLLDDNSGDAILECWASMTDLMSQHRRAWRAPVPGGAIDTSGRTADVRGQALDGSQSRTSRPVCG